jgi:hypothetical protein
MAIADLGTRVEPATGHRLLDRPLGRAVLDPPGAASGAERPASGGDDQDDAGRPAHRTPEHGLTLPPDRPRPGAVQGSEPRRDARALGRTCEVAERIAGYPVL